MQWFKLHCISVHHMEFTSEGVSSASLSWSLLLSLSSKIKPSFCFFPFAGVVSATTSLALQDWWGLDRTALLTVESRWTSHSQHHWIPCKCEVGVRMVARIHVLRSVFMHKLVWFQLLLARKEEEPENSQTPEPFLTTPAPPTTTTTNTGEIRVFSLISLLPSS